MALSVRAPLQKTVFGCMVCGFALHQQLAQQGGRHLLYFNVLSVLNRRLPQSVQCHCVCFGCNSNQVLRRLQFLRFARYAQSIGRSFLPADSATVEMWLVNDVAATVNAGNIDTYIRPVNTAHELNAFKTESSDGNYFSPYVRVTGDELVTL